MNEYEKVNEEVVDTASEVIGNTSGTKVGVVAVVAGLVIAGAIIAKKIWDERHSGKKVSNKEKDKANSIDITDAQEIKDTEEEDE